MKDLPTIALVGNPNSGKTSLFNQLTGLRQKTGNFAGVTVDKKTGLCPLDRGTEALILDLPGTYSLYPKSLDEQVVLDVLANPQHPDYPDVTVVVVDASNLKRNLLLYTQIADLGFHTVLALNLVDVAERHGLDVDPDRLSDQLGVPVVAINARTGEGVNNLKFALRQELKAHFEPQRPQLPVHDLAPGLLDDVKKTLGLQNDYQALLFAGQYQTMRFLRETDRKTLDDLSRKYAFRPTDVQASETLERYRRIGRLVDASVKSTPRADEDGLTARLDRVMLHPVWGYLIFLGILFLIFQSIFSLAQYPMDAIDGGVASLTEWLKTRLPASRLTDLLTDGLLAGIGGVVVFIPQIAFLFLFISLLEESGYMARVMVLMDKGLRRFGLNGRSVVPLISGVACAVPAIMSTRSINNWKDRLITIMVTPLMSCSARLPIYTILIALVVPNRPVLALFSLQGLALMGLYLLGFVAALLSAWVMKAMVKTRERSYFIMELPTYQLPRWNHVGLSIWNAVKAFTIEAGKVIVAISIVLWVLATYGPGDAIERAEARVRREAAISPNPGNVENAVAAARLEHSYAGYFGKALEPAIRPLGYDWKIGIALLTSFAAREVFVGTMATIYSLGSDVDDAQRATVKERLRAEINPDTGGPRFTPAVAFSLLVFYAFAMQCMSTLATTYRETKGWRYPLIQLFYMTGLAYLAAFLVYQTLA
jgi:ferrous iron transport protein B